MKIMKTLVGNDGSGSLYLMDTIEHEGGLWLVPTWIVFRDEKVRKPSRIIRLDVLPHQKASIGGADYLLNVPLAKELVGSARPAHTDAQFVVIEAPDIEVSIPDERWF